jgi:structure-specific recognition protein 1
MDNGRNCALWLQDAQGAYSRFEGLKAGEFERINSFLQTHAAVKLTKRELSSKGRNYGSCKVVGGFLHLLDDEGALIAPLPLSAVGMVPRPNKNEVEIQCIEDDTVEKEDEVLVEMKLYVPPSANIGETTSSSAEAADASMDEEGEDGETRRSSSRDAANKLHKLISEAADVNTASGESLVEFPEDVCQFLVPRGRFKVELFPTFLRLVGSTATFTVNYKSVTRIVYLPVPVSSNEGWKDAKKYAIVLSLDDPIRQGLQRHAHLVMNLDRVEYDVKLRIPAEDIAAGKYEGLGSNDKTAKGELPKLIAGMYKRIIGKPVFKPENFESSKKQRGVRCNHKAQEGHLFPLEKSMIWIHKPTVFIRYSDIEVVDIQRFAGGSALRTWDLLVKCRASGGERATDYLFQSIDKSEKQPIVDFLKSKQVTVKEEKASHSAAMDMDLGDDEDDEEDEEDDDFSGGGEDDDDDDDDDEGDDEDGEGGGDDDDEGFKKKSKKGKKSSTSKKKSSKPPKKKSKKDDDDD